jgi:hypothetical protein
MEEARRSAEAGRKKCSQLISRPHTRSDLAHRCGASADRLVSIVLWRLRN